MIIIIFMYYSFKPIQSSPTHLEWIESRENLIKKQWKKERTLPELKKKVTVFHTPYILKLLPPRTMPRRPSIIFLFSLFLLFLAQDAFLFSWKLPYKAVDTIVKF